MEPLDLTKSLESLRNDGVIITPSESCYGLSCAATSPKAVQKIFTLKNRPDSFPLTLLVSELSQLDNIAVLNETAIHLAAAFMPAQLNLIVDLKNPEKYSYLSNNKSIAFRIPAHPVLYELVAEFDAAITTTSLNVHGQPALYDVKAAEEFAQRVDAFINAGDLNANVPTSTVYDTRTDTIIREGKITHEMIKKALKF